MKKKIMIGALAALFLSVGIFAATNLQEKEQVSDLTLANIEAMTALGDEDNPVLTPCEPLILCQCCYWIRTDKEVLWVVQQQSIRG